MPNDAQPAESSPAPSAPFNLETLTPPERENWRLTGDLPSKEAPPATEPPVESSPADSTPAEPVEQVASTETLPEAASEPAPPRKSKADTRFQELLAERARERDRADKAERELQALKAIPPKTDVPASSPAAGFPEFDAWAEQRPGESYDTFLLEKFEHVQAQKQIQAQYSHQQAEFYRHATERQTAFQQRFHDAVRTDASLPSRINAQLYDLKTVDACLQAGEPVTALNAVAQEIVESPLAAKLLVHLSDHPDELEALRSLPPAAVIRQMAKLEARLDSPAIPPPKTVSSAPAVTTTLGSRPAVPADALKHATQTGDYARYKELANQRDIALKGV